MPKKKEITLISWNVNGIRAAGRKGFLDWIAARPADIIGVQETKAHPEQLGMFLLHPDGYESYWNSAMEKKGYSGTAIYSQISPIGGSNPLGNKTLDTEGRIVCLEYEQFYLFNVYFPNGGGKPERFPYKLKFYDAFFRLIQKYRKKKPVIFIGDVNVAHRPIDIARPEANKDSIGFLPEERAFIDRLIKAGYIDTFRHVHGDKVDEYSWWSYRAAARERNVGWRIDYCFVSDELKKNIKDAWIDQAREGSDHCPVGVKLVI